MKQISIDKLLTVIYSLLLINSLLTISQFFIRYLFLENINLDFIYPSLYFIHEAMPFYGVGFTTHPSTNAFFLIFAIGLSLYKIINSEKKVDYIILSIGFLALYCTLSRTAIFITMLSLLLLFFINKKVFIKALSIEIILYGAFIFIPFDSNYGDKISILTYLGTHNKEYSLQDTSKISRTLNIKNDLNMFQKLDFYEKIFGLKLSYYEHKSTYVKHELMPENEKSYLLEQQSPHFLPFYMIFKYGLILFILIGIFILFVTLYVFKNKNFTSLYFLYLSYCLMLYSYTHDLFDNRLYWLVLGLCAVYSKRHNE